jgi:hypothetical protein
MRVQVYYKRWKRYRLEAGIIGSLLAIAWGVRYLAALYAGIEVDEPIYRSAAAYAAQYGFPALRAEYHQQTIPFLYHPPFFLLILAQWFRLWHSTSFLTGRLFNVCASTLLLGLLYLFIRSKIGRLEAVLALLLIGSDVWIIFTNQAIYLENSQLILIVLAVWAYWWATEADVNNGRQMARRYLIAGLLVGCVLIYKQIGGFLILSILANWLFQRRHHRGHILLLVTALAILAEYLLVMHLSFGSLFDDATFVQIERTLWGRSSAGLSYGPLAALAAIGSRYWMFITTILTLLGGSALAITRAFQHLFRKRQGNTILLSWALGGIVFALSISLKSPHYMILWLVPLYLLIIQEGCRWARRRMVPLQRETWMALATVILLLINLWSFQARFLHVPGNTLAEADAYINKEIPASAVVVTEDYIGVDIRASYININFVQTPGAVYHSGAQYLALYWSTTEPLPKSLGDITSYCMPMATFSGFKDAVEICQVNQKLLAERYAPTKLIERPARTRSKP